MKARWACSSRISAPHVIEHDRGGQTIPQILRLNDLLGIHVDLYMPADGIHSIRQRSAASSPQGSNQLTFTPPSALLATP